MYGPVSKDGPSMEFGEVGEEIKDEARRRVVKEIAAKLKVDADDVTEITGTPVEEIDPFWSKENQKHLEAAAERLDSGKGEMHELIPLND